MLKISSLALCALLCAPALANAAGDPAHGAALFRQACAGCHTAEKGAANGVGPALFGVMGRPAGHAPGFAYSPALKRSRLTWTAGALDHWLRGPSAVAPGTTMLTPPVADAKDRRDLVAYLATRASRKGRCAGSHPSRAACRATR